MGRDSGARVKAILIEIGDVKLCESSVNLSEVSFDASVI